MALSELRDYESENADWPPKDPPVQKASGGFEAGAIYAALLILVFVLEQNHAFGADWIGKGASRSDLLISEPWRAVTALTLHTGPPHLISNLLFGVLFGFLVSINLGGGIAWLAILLAGTLGNLLNGALRGPATGSIGASTAVFAAVGILVGCEWRRRVLLREQRLRRAAPFVMGALILGYFGMGGENTDVAAHVTGLFAGFLVGLALARVPLDTIHRKKTQLFCGAFAILLLGAAWGIALSLSGT